MKLTQLLLREAINVYRKSPLRMKNSNIATRFKQLWEHKISIYKEHPYFEPKIVKEKGYEVVDPLARPPLVRWEPPVPDDPKFTVPQKEDHPNWHDEPVLSVNKSVRLIEGEKQACILTKAQSFEGLPPSVEELIGKYDIPNVDELMQRAILQAHVWDSTSIKLPKRYSKIYRNWKYKAEYGIPQEKIAQILHSSILRLCSMLSTQCPELLTDRRVIEDAFINTCHHFNGTPIMIQGTHQFLLTSSQPLPPFGDESLVDGSVQHELPDMFPMLPTIDLHKTNIYTLENNAGWKAPYSCNVPHTLVISNNMKRWNSNQLNANAMIYLFGHLMSHAKAKYGPDVKSLPEPLCAQCIHSNGINFHFIFFQLNTLNFDSSDGIKNFVWFDRDNAMFNKVIPKRAMLRNTKYEDYDPEVFKKVLAVYMNGVKDSS